MYGGPVKDEIEFIGQYLFAGELLRYVKNKYGEKQWYIKDCTMNYDGEYYATFKDYWNPPLDKDKLLIIRIVKKGDRWEFSVHKEVTGKAAATQENPA